MTTLATIQAVSIATVANIVGRAANVALPLAVIAVYGANGHTDQFFLVLALAFFCYGTLANAISESTVPLLISSGLRLNPSNILMYSIGISLLSLPIGLLWHWLGTGFDMIYIVALALMIGAGLANGFFSGILNAQERYAPAGLTWALRFIPLAFFVMGQPAKDQLPWLALGIGIMDWLRCGILIRCGRKTPIQSKAIDLSQFIMRYRSTYGTIFLAMIIMGFNPLIDRLIAQLSGPGGVSILDTADRVYGILGTLCTMGLMTVLLTRLSMDASNDRLEQKWPGALKMVTIWCFMWVSIGILGGYFGLDWWLTHGTALTPQQCAQVKQTYWYYLIGLPSFAIGVVYAKRLQAVRRTTTLVVTAALAVILNLLASFALHSAIGIAGIALATTLVYTTTAIILISVVHRSERGASGPPTNDFA